MNEEAEIADEKDWRELEPSYPVKVFLTVLYSLILVTGIVGNAVTIRVTQVLQHNGYLQKNVTDHMVSLACSDLLVLLIGMPVELYIAIWYPFMSASGNAACKIYNFLFEACSYATILNVATLSFELPKHESSKVKTARKQTILFLGLIVGALMVCWLPNQIRRLMAASVPKSDWTMSYFRSYIILHTLGDTFFYLSSVLNPFLYNLSSRQFRDVFVQVMRCHLTIEHVNKRTLQSSRVTSARSLRPLLSKSLRRSRGNRSTTPPSFTTFQSNSDSGVASNTQESLCLTEGSDSIPKIKANVPSETEI
ncbi:G-protein coupled receptor 39 [Diretmus argenteus]